MDPTVLRYKLLNGSVLEVANLMAEWKMPIDTPLFPGSHTLLTFAIAFEPEAVETLLRETHADINVADGYGDLPLVLALRNRPLFNMLAARGAADLNARDKRGNTALIEAAALGDMEAVGILLGDGRLNLDAHAQGARALGRAAAGHYNDIVKAIVRALWIDPASARAESNANAEPRPKPKRMSAPEAWALLDAEPGFYFTDQGQGIPITDARDLTVLYMQRLRDAVAIEDQEQRMLRERAIGLAYEALLPEFRKNPK
jgi:hypothetical protein